MTPLSGEAAMAVMPNDARALQNEPPDAVGLAQVQPDRSAVQPEPDGIDPLERYAAGIDTSDYVARVVPLIRAAVPSIGDLLDIGAGGGQLGARLRMPERAWTVVEPAPMMQRRLQAYDPSPHILRRGWKEADLTAACADTVLAANMPAPLTDPVAFLARCREWARGSVVWLVPSQHGPRGICLAGCLPQAWHGEDETPGVEIVLRALPRNDRPAIMVEAAWTFTAVVADLPRTARSLADRLGWAPNDPRRPELLDHLTSQAVPVPGGHQLSVPRASSVLVWRTRA